MTGLDIEPMRADEAREAPAGEPNVDLVVVHGVDGLGGPVGGQPGVGGGRMGRPFPRSIGTPPQLSIDTFAVEVARALGVPG